MAEFLEIESDKEIPVGTIVYIIQFADGKKTTQKEVYTTLQELMEWTEEIWTNMNPYITINTSKMNGEILATIDEEEKLVANVFMLPLQGK